MCLKICCVCWVYPCWVSLPPLFSLAAVARCGRGALRSALVGGCVVRPCVAPLCCGPVPAVFVPGLFWGAFPFCGACLCGSRGGGRFVCLALFGGFPVRSLRSVRWGFSMSFSFSASSLPVLGAVSPVPASASAVALRSALSVHVSALVRSCRLSVSLLGLCAASGRSSPAASPAAVAALLSRARGVWSRARAAGVSPARLAVLARAGRALAAVAPVCPLASGAGVPASCLGVPSSGFVPAASGVVVRGWSVSAGVLSVDVAGFSLPFLCLSSGLSPAAFSSLVDAVSVASASGVSVDLWAAPGRSGFVCRARAGSSGYFCAVSL